VHMRTLAIPMQWPAHSKRGGRTVLRAIDVPYKHVYSNPSKTLQVLVEQERLTHC
jgi:hypothetical protein